MKTRGVPYGVSWAVWWKTTSGIVRRVAGVHTVEWTMRHQPSKLYPPSCHQPSNLYPPSCHQPSNLYPPSRTGAGSEEQDDNQQEQGPHQAELGGIGGVGGEDCGALCRAHPVLSCHAIMQHEYALNPHKVHIYSCRCLPHTRIRSHPSIRPHPQSEYIRICARTQPDLPNPLT